MANEEMMEHMSKPKVEAIAEKVSRSRRPMVTSFIGVIGSGKDYRAGRMILGRMVPDPQITRVDFKDDLLDMVSDIVGYDVRKDYEWFKEHPVGVMRPSNPLAEAFLRSEWKAILEKYPNIITGRMLLQRVGTEAIRNRHPNYWIDRFDEKAQDFMLGAGSDIVNADTRFFNEVERLMSETFRAKFIFCNFKSERYNPNFDHPSEHLAQTFVHMGLEDGQEIPLGHFYEAARRMGKPFNPPV